MYIVWKTAYAEICLTWPEPSLKMAACCWLDPFWQLVIPGLQFLEKAYLGIGAVAIKDVPEGEKQFGNPARKVLELKKK